MSPQATVDRKKWSVRILACGLFLSIFFLSLDFDPAAQAGVAKNSYSSLAKVRKSVKYSHGTRTDIALTPTSVRWSVFSHPCFLSLADKQNLPGLRLLKSIIIRAPPSVRIV